MILILNTQEKNHILYKMEGRVCVVRSHSELSAIDKELLNDMCHGVEIYILKDTHITKCGGDRARFNTLIRNNDRFANYIYPCGHG